MEAGTALPTLGRPSVIPLLPGDPAGQPPGIDHVARWRTLVRAREEQGRRLDPLHGRPDPWGDNRAARFRHLVSEAGPDALFALIRPFLRPDLTVLDVGAGVGRHVIPIAPLVRKVIAVEPSAAMRRELQDMIRASGLANVEVIAAAWPDADVTAADLVICSHVVYVVAEIEPFLRRLAAVCRGRCYVTCRWTQREAPILPLFEEVWGESRCPEPTFADLLGVADQLGLRGQVTTIPFGAGRGFESFEAAVAAVRADLLNPPDAAADARIREYLAGHLRLQEGRWVLEAPPMFAGVLWWEAGR